MYIIIALNLIFIIHTLINANVILIMEYIIPKMNVFVVTLMEIRKEDRQVKQAVVVKENMLGQLN